MLMITKHFLLFVANTRVTTVVVPALIVCKECQQYINEVITEYLCYNFAACACELIGVDCSASMENEATFNTI